MIWVYLSDYTDSASFWWRSPVSVVSVFLSLKTPAVVNLTAPTFEGHYAFRYDGTRRRLWYFWFSIESLTRLSLFPGELPQFTPTSSIFTRMACILSRIFPRAKVSTYGKSSVSATSQVNNPETPWFSSQANFFLQMDIVFICWYMHSINTRKISAVLSSKELEILYARTAMPFLVNSKSWKAQTLQWLRRLEQEMHLVPKMVNSASLRVHSAAQDMKKAIVKDLSHQYNRKKFRYLGSDILALPILGWIPRYHKNLRSTRHYGATQRLQMQTVDNWTGI